MITRSISQLAHAIASWSEAEPHVRACFWFGGHGYRRLWAGSDLDVALLLEDGYAAPALEADLRAALSGPTGVVQHAIRHDHAVALWVDDRPTKIDVVYATRAEDLAWLADATDVPAPRLVAAWTTGDPGALALLDRAGLAHDPTDLERRKLLATREADKFILAFDACSSAHAKSDAYGCYFHYNLALGRLLRIVQLVRAGASYVYQPRNVLAGSMSFAEQGEMRSLAGSLYLPDMLVRKRALAARFLTVLDEARATLAVERDPAVLGRLLARIQRRDAFFNVRDVAASFDGLVRPGQLLRASALSRWSGTDELRNWLQTTGVSDIVDLRSEPERTRTPYTSTDLDGRRYHHLPIVQDGPEIAGTAFLSLARAYAQTLQRVMEILASANGTVVVHCHVGKHRTGWVLALLQAAIGLPTDMIQRDYLASLTDVSPTHIPALLDTLSAAGGAARLLEDIGVPPELLATIRTRLISDGGIPG